ncbi:phosphocholine cytidylyltransferase family protein [Sphingosinicella sp. LHD-64]|uniref:phosphocholine cytidylyltransferase family protein n=1 Tax=Sphingosinicella sp. LHD-64 TaxID=3072139 RepID=UPI00280F1AA4|nr:phosphocholine cytidylyltransferase family protein [Sphingosinicella sp. LHD-64]MDQ8757540.1 phosphocholine cytidylyltransferase family protein [Sphingosinicella sp. LHD-64]
MSVDASGGMISKALVLSAGNGSRLLPLTAERPKCLLELGGKSLLERQLDALEGAGIGEIVVVTGFRDDLVEATIAARPHSRSRVRTLYNPFYHVADNLGSVWIARREFDADILLLNGDTLVTAELVAHVLAGASGAINVAIDRKAHYDADDMKVLDASGRLLRIGKTLPQQQTTGESIGLLAFQRTGRSQFVDMVERAIRAPDGMASWYLRAIDRLADETSVRTVSIEGFEWAEIDFQADYEAAQRLCARWDARAAA